MGTVWIIAGLLSNINTLVNEICADVQHGNNIRPGRAASLVFVLYSLMATQIVSVHPLAKVYREDSSGALTPEPQPVLS